MGKKSRKGQSRAGLKARPAAGQSARRVGKDGLSLASGDAMSIESSEVIPGKKFMSDVTQSIKNKASSSIPKSISTPAKADKPTPTGEDSSEKPSTSLLGQMEAAVDKQVAQASEQAYGAIQKQAEEAQKLAAAKQKQVEEAAAAKQREIAAKQKEMDEAYERKKAEVAAQVAARKKELAAQAEAAKQKLEETAAPAPAPATTTEEPKVTSRGFPALDEPAEAEKNVSQKDCACAGDCVIS